MKLNIIINETQKREDYENITPDQLPSIVDAAYEDIELNNIIEFNPQILPAAISKLRRGGRLKLNIIDIHKLIGNTHNRLMTLPDFSQTLAGRNVFFAPDELKALVQQHGLQIISIDHYQYNFIFEMQRG